MTKEKSYSINKEKDTLTFITSSFRADRGSVLYKGIYNYEFASMLSALAICGIVYVFFAFNYKMTLIHYLTIIIVFAIAFLIFRKFIFRERYLKIVFDKSNKIVKIDWPRLISTTEEIPFSNIKSVEIGSKKIVPENPDGIRFVERISLQHGGIIPDLGDEVEFVTLLLKLNDGSERLIYAAKIEGKIEGEPEVPLNEIKNFLMH
jgi:hypothetical protein